jgi:NitT/TauT family transport system substrate-binding protein
MDRSLEYARKRPAEVRRIVPTFAPIADADARRMKLPVFTSKLDTAALMEVAQAGERFGFIAEPPSFAQLVYQPEEGG